MIRICKQFVYVRGGHALVSGEQIIDVRSLRWPDGMRSAWVAYESHDGGVIGIAETRRHVLEAVA